MIALALSCLMLGLHLEPPAATPPQVTPDMPGSVNPFERRPMYRLGPIRGSSAWSDDRLVLAAVTEGGTIELLHLGAEAQGEVLLEGLPENVTAISFEPGTRVLWFAFGERVGRIDLRKTAVWDETSFAIRRPGGEIDGLAAGEGRVAWSCSGAGSGGIVESEGGKEVARLTDLTPAALAGGSPSLVEFDGSGRFAVFQKKESRRLPEHLRQLVVLDAKDGRRVGLLTTFRSMTTSGAALSGGMLYYCANRSTARDWEGWIERLDMEREFASAHLYPSRMGNATDLFASADGSWIAEWEFSEGSVRVFFLMRDWEPRDIALPEGARPMGWSDDGEVIWAASEKQIWAIDPRTGRLDEMDELGLGQEKIVGVRGGLRGDVMVEWERSKEGGMERFVSVMGRKPER